MGEDNIISKCAMTAGYLRFLTPQLKISDKEKITKVVKKHLLGTTAIVEFQKGIPSMLPTANNIRIT